MTDETELPEHKMFTAVFAGDLNKWRTNPFHEQTVFGKPVTLGVGDAYEWQANAQEALDDLFDALSGLMAVFPPSGRTSEQMAAFQKAGKALAKARDF